MSPILIVGAGPVGLTMAIELARFGLAVRVIDKAPHATETSKALVVWSRTLELMDRMGCSAAFLDTGLRAHGATIRNGDKELGHANFDDIASPYNFALMIPQRDTERLLGDHLKSFGVVVERNVELIRFSEAPGGITAQLKQAHGSLETVEAPWLLGCDGAHSSIRHGLNLPFEGYVQEDDWMLADVRLRGPNKPPGDRICTYMHKDGPFVIFPIPGDRARVVAVVGRTDPNHARPDPTLAEVQAMVDARTGGGFEVYDPVWLSNFRINERKVKDYGHGRVFLSGDAAHVHSPAGGQGMNTGMQDAINLAWKLAMVSAGVAAPTLLDSYSVERSAVGDLVLRNAGRLTDIGTLTNPAAQIARNLAMRVLLGLHAVQDRMATQMSEIDIGYPKSPLSVGPHAGTRLTPTQYDGPPPGTGAAPRFVMFADDRAQGDALTARFPQLLEPAPRTPPAGEAFLIVRPDGYIGCATEDAAEAAQYLNGIAAAPG